MASPNVVTLTQQNFSEEVLKSATPVLVDFWATWCGPCKMIAPMLDELADEYAGRAKVAKVDVDEQQQIAIDYRIQSMPTLLFFKNGEPAGQLVGSNHSKRSLKEAFDRLLQ